MSRSILLSSRSLMIATLLSAGGISAFGQYSSPVRITNNTPAQSVPVKDQDNPARQPVTAKFACTMAAGVDSCFGANYSLPAGKTLVMEAITFRSSSTFFTGKLFCTFQGNTAPTFTDVYFSPTFIGRITPINSDIHVANLQTKVYFSTPGSSVNLYCIRDNSTASLDATGFFFGHLVDVP
jgi:hypothetical protein